MQNKLRNERLKTPATTQKAPDEAPRNDRRTTINAEGRLLNLSRTIAIAIAIAEATLTDAQGKLYAHATCTCSINRG